MTTVASFVSRIPPVASRIAAGRVESRRVARRLVMAAALAAGALVAPRAAGAQDRVYLQLEGGGSAFVSSPQSAQFGVGLYAAGRVGARLAGPLGAHFFGSYGYWSARTGQIDSNTGAPSTAGSLGLFGGGLRLAPTLSPTAGHLYLDLDAGVALTGANFQQPFLGAGVGWNIPLGASFAIGPVVRYGEVLTTSAFIADARNLTFGVALSMPGHWQAPEGRAARGGRRVYFQLEAGADLFVSSSQRQQFGVGLAGSGRLGARLAGPLGVHLTGAYSYWAARTGQIDANTQALSSSAALAWVGGGLRLAPELSAALGELYLDLEAGVALTGANFQQPVVSAGVGWNIPLGGGASLGPVVRYTEVLTDQSFVADARILTAGLALAFPASDAAGSWDGPPERLYAQVEGGGDALVSAPQSNQFGVGFYGAGRVGARLVGPVGLHAFGSYSYWAARSGQIDANTGAPSASGRLGVVGGGVRVAPEISRSLGHVYLDVEAGVGFTGANFQQPVVGAGLGWNIPLGRWVSVGPVVRYGQVISTGAQIADARMVTFGVALSLPGAPAEPAPVIGDLDGDGVLDPSDLCPAVPRGPRPDPDRLGCPLPEAAPVVLPAAPADRDGDGVLDRDDQCVDVPMGLHPDPTRRGCPEGDRDGDGVLDRADECVDVPAGDRPDPTRAGCPAPAEAPQAATVIQGRINITEPIFFDLDRTTIQARSFAILDAVARVMTEHAEILTVRVEGHTDDQGRARRNLRLSRGRAEAVVAYLVQHGIAPGRLTSVGYGSTRPAVQGHSDAARAANRRVDFIITGGPGAAPDSGGAAPEEGHHGHHHRHGGGGHGGGHHHRHEH